MSRSLAFFSASRTKLLFVVVVVSVFVVVIVVVVVVVARKGGASQKMASCFSADLPSLAGSVFLFFFEK
jgi:hypothetical protein